VGTPPGKIRHHFQEGKHTSLASFVDEGRESLRFLRSENEVRNVGGNAWETAVDFPS
jgi:hypothetical protein